MTDLVFFSSASRNTARYVEALGRPAKRIQRDLEVAEPFILLVPTYASGDGRGAVPKPVIWFLNNPKNRGLLRGVIAFGNRNFGETFCLGGRIVAAKCGVPLLQQIELAGTSRDIETTLNLLETPWITTPSTPN